MFILGISVTISENIHQSESSQHTKPLDFHHIVTVEKCLQPFAAHCETCVCMHIHVCA